MAKVVQMRAFRSRDSAGELRELLLKAIKGDVGGLVFAVEFADGTQRLGFTGKFRADPAEATKMAHHLCKLLQTVEGSQADSRAGSL